MLTILVIAPFVSLPYQVLPAKTLLKTLGIAGDALKWKKQQNTLQYWTIIHRNTTPLPGCPMSSCIWSSWDQEN